MLRWSYMQLFSLLQTNGMWGTLLVFVKIVFKHLSSLKQHAMVGELMICCEKESLNTIKQWKDTRYQIPENEAAIVPNINNDVAAGYDRTVSIGKVLEIDDSDAKISFYGHAGTLSIGSIFRKPKKRDEIWVDFVNILCVVQVPAETNRRTKLKSLC